MMQPPQRHPLAAPLMPASDVQLQQPTLVIDNGKVAPDNNATTTQQPTQQQQPKHWSVFYSHLAGGLEQQPPPRLHYLHIAWWCTVPAGWDYYQHRHAKKREVIGHSVVWLHTAQPRDRFVFLITPVEKYRGSNASWRMFFWRLIYGKGPAFAYARGELTSAAAAAAVPTQLVSPNNATAGFPATAASAAATTPLMQPSGGPFLTAMTEQRLGGTPTPIARVANDSDSSSSSSDDDVDDNGVRRRLAASMTTGGDDFGATVSSTASSGAASTATRRHHHHHHRNAAGRVASQVIRRLTSSSGALLRPLQPASSSASFAAGGANAASSSSSSSAAPASSSSFGANGSNHASASASSHAAASPLGVEVVEVLHSDITAMDYAPGLTSSRLALETKVVAAHWFASIADACAYYRCPVPDALLQQQKLHPPGAAATMLRPQSTVPPGMMSSATAAAAAVPTGMPAPPPMLARGSTATPPPQASRRPTIPGTDTPLRAAAAAAAAHRDSPLGGELVSADHEPQPMPIMPQSSAPAAAATAARVSATLMSGMFASRQASFALPQPASGVAGDHRAARAADNSSDDDDIAAALGAAPPPPSLLRGTATAAGAAQQQQRRQRTALSTADSQQASLQNSPQMPQTFPAAAPVAAAAAADVATPSSAYLRQFLPATAAAVDGAATPLTAASAARGVAAAAAPAFVSITAPPQQQQPQSSFFIRGGGNRNNGVITAAGVGGFECLPPVRTIRKHDTMVQLFVQDPHFNAVLRDVLLPEPGTHPFTASLSEQRRLLAMFETGMPSWCMFFSRVGLPYRRVYRLVAVGVVNAWPLIALCVGLYDLYKHLPYVTEFLSEALAPLSGWLDNHFTLRVSMLATYIFTVSFSVLQALHGFFKAFVAAATFLFAPLLPLLTVFRALWFGLKMVFGVLFTALSPALQLVSLIFATLRAILVGPFTLLKSFFGVLGSVGSVASTAAAPVQGTVKSASYFFLVWRQWMDFWEKVARPVKNLAKACYDGIVHVGVSLARREASIRRYYRARAAAVARFAKVWRDVLATNIRLAAMFLGWRSTVFGLLAWVAAVAYVIVLLQQWLPLSSLVSAAAVVATEGGADAAVDVASAATASELPLVAAVVARQLLEEAPLPPDMCDARFGDL